MLEYIRTILDARRRDDGASAVEYGLLIGAIAAVIVAAVFVFSGFVSNIFEDTETQICEEGAGEGGAGPVAGCE